MTEQEQIEKWREEFELNLTDCNKDRHEFGDYVRDSMEYMWQGFCMAKRAQKPVVLPRPWTDEHGYRHINLQHLEVYFKESGIPYTVKGE